MLLELITGRPPLDLTGEMEDSLVDWVSRSPPLRFTCLIPKHFPKQKQKQILLLLLQARPLCLKAAQDGDYNQLADPRLELNYSHQEMVQMASCAAAAIRHSARRRPKMSQVQKLIPLVGSIVIFLLTINLDDKCDILMNLETCVW